MKKCNRRFAEIAVAIAVWAQATLAQIPGGEQLVQVSADKSRAGLLFPEMTDRLLGLLAVGVLIGGLITVLDLMRRKADRRAGVK